MLCIIAIIRGAKHGIDVDAQCFCGKIFRAKLYRIQSGHTRSCGCLVVSVNRGKARKHGMYGTPTYIKWQRMLQRCRDVNHDSYPYYGARGITVCERWTQFESFLTDMGEVPPGLTLERINNSLGYYKENCRWATWHDQSYNKRNTRYCTINGATKTVYEWAQLQGIRPGVIYLRLSRGWPEERAVLYPVSHSRKAL